jgi:RNA polymerase sigma factor (sigma-70 family)
MSGVSMMVSLMSMMERSTYMDVRDLEQVRWLDVLINGKLEERDQLMALATRMNPDADGMPHGKGTVSDPVGNGAVKLVELAGEIDHLIDQYVDQKQKVVQALEQLPEDEYVVLHMHYVQYVSWAKICKILCYTRQQVWRIKKKALKKLEDVT